MYALACFEGRMKAFRNVKRVELKNIPSLSVLILRFAFKLTEVAVVENASLLEEREELVEVKRRMKKAEELEALKKICIQCQSDWDGLTLSLVEVIFVSDNSCNESGLEVLDLSGFVNLRELNVGSLCCMYVKVLKLIGLNHLERVVIGNVSFAEKKETMEFVPHPENRFYLKDCPAVRELRIGRVSFMYYSVCIIENTPSLESITIGDLKEKGFNFVCDASLELKSC